MYQYLNRAIPSRKCSIKAPAKWRNSIYVLMEICYRTSKLQGLWPVVMAESSRNISFVENKIYLCHQAALCLSSYLLYDKISPSSPQQCSFDTLLRIRKDIVKQQCCLMTQVYFIFLGKSILARFCRHLPQIAIFFLILDYCKTHTVVRGLLNRRFILILPHSLSHLMQDNRCFHPSYSADSSFISSFWQQGRRYIGAFRDGFIEVS